MTLPSPFALAHGTDVTPKAMAEGILKPQLDAIDADLVVFEEPYLAREESPDLGAGGGPEGPGGRAEARAWLTFANARHALEQGVADLSVDAIGIDLTQPQRRDHRRVSARFFSAGLDARSWSSKNRARSPRSWKRRERGVEEIALLPNGDLQYVSSRSRARRSRAWAGEDRDVRGGRMSQVRCQTPAMSPGRRSVEE